MPSQHETLASYEDERSIFNRRYGEELKTAVGILGPPRLRGSDTDENRHEYAIWRGQTGLLILQQSAYDPQFGFDINYWIHPWVGPDPKPTHPFIDWLTALPAPAAEGR